MTLKKMTVDVSNLFAKGQVYVAMCRTRSLEGGRVVESGYTQDSDGSGGEKCSQENFSQGCAMGVQSDIHGKSSSAKGKDLNVLGKLMIRVSIDTTFCSLSGTSALRPKSR